MSSQPVIDPAAAVTPDTTATTATGASTAARVQHGERRHVVVLGAGLSGLATAHRLHVDEPDVTITVVDAAPTTGGKIRTESFDGVALDCAADAFLARVPEGLELCRELGLADQLVSPAQSSAFVWSHDALRRLPTGLVLGVPTDLDALEQSGIVSKAAARRAGQDLMIGDAPAAPHPDDPTGSDESVGSLVRRRMGDEVAERLVAPLLGGVNAGDADRLSLAAGAPQLAAAVAGQPSLIAGLRAQATKNATDEPRPVFYGLPDGSSTLIDALVGSLPDGTVHLSTSATSLTPQAHGRWHVGVTTPGGTETIDADAVVSALPAHALAPLLDSIPGDDLDDVVDGLAELEWASVAMVALAVPTASIQHPLDGSGYLVAVPDRRLVTACSFASSKWAHLARPGRALLRVSVGHAGDHDAGIEMSDDEITSGVCADLAEHLGMTGRPEEVRITRWRRGLPQYRPGHLDRCRSWQQRVSDRHPGLTLTGASFEGLGIPACIRQGTTAAEATRNHLRGLRPR